MRSSIEPSLSPPGLYTDVPSTLSEEITSLDVVVVTMSTPPINECDTFMRETRGHQYQSPAAIRRRKRPRSRRHARQKSGSVDARLSSDDRMPHPTTTSSRLRHTLPHREAHT